MWTDPLSWFPYLFLLAAILSLWLKRDAKIWGGLAILSVVFGIIAGRLEWMGAGSIAALGACYYLAHKAADKNSRLLSGAARAAALSAALAAHLAPGFNNWKIVDQLRLGEASLPYSMWLNLDKPFIGLFILGFGAPLIKRREDWKQMFGSVWPIFAVGLIILIICAYSLGYVRFEPKWRNLFAVWAINSLFFTCAAEEAFFRGFLQRHLSTALRRFQWGNLASAGTAGLLFGAAHFSGGLKYVALASIAGFMYGWAYNKTQKIEAAIACHFGVNSFRFLFLTYPAAAG